MSKFVVGCLFGFIAGIVGGVLSVFGPEIRLMYKDKRNKVKITKIH